MIHSWKTTDKKNIILVLSGIFIFCGTIALSFVGTIHNDPMHYIATTHRFYLGDAMLVHDWSAEQTEAFLLLPFFRLFMKIFDSTDGIMLYYCFIYNILKTISALYGIHRINKRNMSKIAYLGIGGYWIFTPYNLGILSYNTIPMIAFFVILITLITTESNKSDYFLCGLMMGIAVIAQPFCMLVAISIVVLELFRKNRYFKHIMYFIMGRLSENLAK